MDLEIKTRHEADSVVGHQKRCMALKQRCASVVTPSNAFYSVNHTPFSRGANFACSNFFPALLTSPAPPISLRHSKMFDIVELNVYLDQADRIIRLSRIVFLCEVGIRNVSGLD